MNDPQIERIARDLDELKRAVRRNAPELRAALDLRGWDVFSFLFGLAISVFGLGSHVLTAAFGGFEAIPDLGKAIMGAVLAVILVSNGAVKLLMFTRTGPAGSGNVGAILRSFWAGDAKHVHLPLAILLVGSVAAAFLAGRPWLALGASVIVIGLWSNVLVLQTGLRIMLVIGWWGLPAGALALAFAESAPFLWIFITYGAMFILLAAAFRFHNRGAVRPPVGEADAGEDRHG